MDEFSRKLEQVKKLAYELLEISANEEQATQIFEFADEFSREALTLVVGIIEHKKKAGQLHWWEIDERELEPLDLR